MKSCNKEIKREVVQSMINGDTVYFVKFTQSDQDYIKIGKKTINLKNRVCERKSRVFFSKQKQAEAYAKMVYKCDDIDWYNYIKFYPNGYESLEKYGYFRIDARGSVLFSYNWTDTPDYVAFVFNDEYINRFGYHIKIPIARFLSGEDIIPYVMKKINMDVGDIVVKKYTIIED